MFCSSLLLRPISRLAVLVPFVLFASACSGSDDAEAGDGGSGGNATGNAGAGANGAGSGSGGSAGAASGNSGAAGTSFGSAGASTSGVGLAPVPLGEAGEYVILAQSAISNVPTSIITGDLGLSPAAASYVTGFSLTRAGAMWTTPEVVGGVFAADSDDTTPIQLTTAVEDMLTAYADAANRPTPGFQNLGDGAIGGLTLAPGLYKWTSAVTIPTNVTLAGGAQDVWIFQITGDLTLSAAQRMSLSGGAKAKNIVWQVAGSVDVGSTAHAEGVILSKTAIHMGAGSSINGRLLAQTAVTLSSTTVTAPAP